MILLSRFDKKQRKSLHAPDEITHLPASVIH